MGDYVFRKEYNHNMFTFLEVVNCRKTSRQEVYKHWARSAEMDAHNGRALYTSFTNTIKWEIMRIMRCGDQRVGRRTGPLPLLFGLSNQN